MSIDIADKAVFDALQGETYIYQLFVSLVIFWKSSRIRQI